MAEMMRETPISTYGLDPRAHPQDRSRQQKSEEVTEKLSRTLSDSDEDSSPAHIFSRYHCEATCLKNFR